MTYFDKIGPINDYFHQIYVHKLDWTNFLKLLEKKIFDQFPQMSTYYVILAPKMTHFWPFSPKMTYFNQIDPINEMFDHISIHKTEWNNF